MIRRILATAMVVTMTAVTAFTHEGHTHKIMGTISKITNNQVEVQGTDGKKVMVVLNDKTQILKGKVKGAAADLKEGARVVIEAEGEPLVAKSFHLAAAPTVKKS
jgi:O-glycosyl hydrolase